MTSPLLELQHVTKRFGRVVIAEDLSFAVGPGDTVGIVGPNGAGKTSLFGLISGDLSPGAGEISFAGRQVTKLDAAARCRLGIGRTYQVPRPFTDMTVFENVLVAAQQGAALRRRGVAGPAPQPGALLRGDEHVLEHCHVRERPRYLVSSPDAEPAPGGRVKLGDLAPGEGDLPGVGGQVTGDEAEQAGLARSVRPHDPYRVPRIDAERQVLGDDDPAEPFRHVLQVKQWTCHPVMCSSVRAFR